MSGASGIEETDQFKVQIPLRTSRGTAGVAIPLEMGGRFIGKPWGKPCEITGNPEKSGGFGGKIIYKFSGFVQLHRVI